MATIPNNPSLRVSRRHEPGEVIPTKQETSILEWLEASGRMMPREVQEEEPAETDPDMDLIEENNYQEDDNEEDGD
ncbi:MAG: DUF3134 family protein [Cyanobacteriota bacterium]|nr:DUF3134 family protein [Cyanobacteriota bacterium]